MLQVPSETIKACVAYTQNGEEIDYFPYNIEDGIEPVYKELPGWKTDMTQFTSEDQFPKEFKDYIAFSSWPRSGWHLIAVELRDAVYLQRALVEWPVLHRQNASFPDL